MLWHSYLYIGNNTEYAVLRSTPQIMSCQRQIRPPAQRSAKPSKCRRGRTARAIDQRTARGLCPAPVRPRASPPDSPSRARNADRRRRASRFALKPLAATLVRLRRRGRLSSTHARCAARPIATQGGRRVAASGCKAAGILRPQRSCPWRDEPLNSGVAAAELGGADSGAATAHTLRAQMVRPSFANAHPAPLEPYESR